MKKTVFALSLIFFVGLALCEVQAIAQTESGDPGPSYGPGGYGYGYCPWSGRYGGPHGMYGMGPRMMGYGYGMGPRMMYPGYGYGGYGMGPGMMGYGYGMGPGYGGRYGQSERSLDKDQAKREVEDYLKATRNPNLKVGEVQEKGNDYEVNIVTKEGSLVNKLLVNKDTGWMQPAY
jgi:hypothetical protein